MIQLAKLSEIPEIIKLTQACAIAMEAIGIYQCNKDYPSKEAFINDVNRQELYTLKKDAKIVACIVISKYIDAIYKPIKWLTNNQNNSLYLKRGYTYCGEIYFANQSKAPFNCYEL